MLCCCGVFEDLLRLMRPFRKVLFCLLPVIIGLTAGSAVAGLKSDPPPKPVPPPPLPAVVAPQPPPPARPQPAPPPPPPPVQSGNERRYNVPRSVAATKTAHGARIRAARLQAETGEDQEGPGESPRKGPRGGSCSRRAAARAERQRGACGGTRGTRTRASVRSRRSSDRNRDWRACCRSRSC